MLTVAILGAVFFALGYVVVRSESPVLSFFAIDAICDLVVSILDNS